MKIPNSKFQITGKSQTPNLQRLFRPNPVLGAELWDSGFGVYSHARRTGLRFGRLCAAFTLIEMMVVLVVIGIIAAAIIPQFIGTTQDAKVKTAQGNVAELESAVERFYVHMDRHPTTEEGLQILVTPPPGEESKWRGPYIKLLRNDPWGNPYQYCNPGVHHPSSFDLWSRGADGADGGEGPNADVGNW